MQSKLRCIAFGHDLVPTQMLRDGNELETRIATCARCEFRVAFEHVDGGEA